MFDMVDWNTIELILMILGALTVILIILNEYFEGASQAEEE